MIFVRGNHEPLQAHLGPKTRVSRAKVKALPMHQGRASSAESRGLLFDGLAADGSEAAARGIESGRSGSERRRPPQHVTAAREQSAETGTVRRPPAIQARARILLTLGGRYLLPHIISIARQQCR